MAKPRRIELLAPAKNSEIGIEAINHGADAVYIGAPKFSARSAAGNTIDEIEALVAHAHQFGARIYVAFNTILKDEELSEAEKIIWQLYKIGVDAIIIQDMGILMLNLPLIPLHASTQVDNRSIEKIQFLEKAGFSQIVLARELTCNEIKEISKNISTPLEAFVHGALCVCYSGQCYLSEAISQRSANRGSCAQYCRLPYDLTDADGRKIQSKKHLLSMKDLNLSDHLEEMIDAGVSSLKIEGRLKDISYVKNTVAYYRQKLDEIISRRPTEYKRASSGKSIVNFTPGLYKSFNRGFTTYFFHGRTTDIWSINSPKSIGEPIGKISNIAKNYFSIDSKIRLNNGDGLCFLNENKELEGVRVNKVEDGKIYTSDTSNLRKGLFVYRNFDQEFDKLLKNKTADRKISTSMLLRDLPYGFSLEIIDEDNNNAVLNFECEKNIAQKSQFVNIQNNLKKTGNTIFEVNEVNIQFSEDWFIPASLISEWRRKITEKLADVRILSHRVETVSHTPTNHSFPEQNITYLGNVMNEKSKAFYSLHNSEVKEYAFEKQSQIDVPLMFTRHCIKQSMGWCSTNGGQKHPYREPFFLNYNETKLQLAFDCKKCEMKVSRV